MANPPNIPSALTGLLLGAGASYDVGMPLVWELDKKLKSWLTPAKLRGFNQLWRNAGFGYPDAAIDELVRLLEREDMHYENILGHMEVLFRRPERGDTQLREAYHGLYSYLVQMIYYILMLRHTLSIESIKQNIQYLEGIKAFADENKPLWIFSLNYDLMMECLAVHSNLPIKCGFTEEIVNLPLRDPSGATTGKLEAQVLPGEVIETKALPFFRTGEMGINLLKLHGSLDVFAFRDGKDLLKLVSADSSVESVLETLRRANEELRYVDSDISSDVITSTNEIIYADETGVMQFLRRTLLAGAYKFENSSSQVLPDKLLDHFSWNLNYLTRLVCIGYGFGDSHINRIIQEWLAFSGDRRLTIVNPTAKGVPPTLQHLAPQIDLVPLDATKYLDQISGIARDPQDISLIHLRSMQYTSPETMGQFANYLEEELLQVFERVAKWSHTLPMKDGDVDLESLGLTLEELSSLAKLEASIPSMEEVLETFLNVQECPR